MAALTPSRAGLWLGLIYAAAVAAVMLSGADDAMALVLDVLVIPLAIGPAAAAAIGIALSPDAFGKWSFLLCEAAVIASTATGWTYLIVIAPDAQNGIAMLMLAGLQYLGVLLFYVAACALGWRPAPAQR